MKKQKSIAIDFDETLIQNDNDGQVRPMPGAREALKKLSLMGFKIIIHSCRPGLATKEQRRADEISWMASVLEAFDIPFDEIHPSTKPVAQFYVDDRAVAFNGNWDDTMKTIEHKSKPKLKVA